MPTVVDAQPLVDAITAAIGAQSLAVGDGEKPTVATGLPYVVHWMGGGTTDDRSLKSRDGFRLTAPFQVYGFDPDSVRWALTRLKTAMLGLHLTVVGGRTVQMPVQEDGPPMSRDDDADPPLWWQYDEWRIRTS